MSHGKTLRRLIAVQRPNSHSRAKALIWLGLAALILGLAGCAGPSMPPITAEPTNQQLPGKVVWHDLLTPQREEAKEFYGGLLGWTFQDREDYSLALLNGKPVAGLANFQAKPKAEQESWWVISFSVGDVDEAARIVEQDGGRVIKGPAEMSGRGRFVLVADAQKAPVALLRAQDGDPYDAPPILNGWLWNELWTNDLAASGRFYEDLLGMELDPAPGRSDGQYIVMGRDGKWRAGMTGLPFDELNPQWVPCLRVADLAVVLKKAESMGARTLINPDHALNQNGTALIEDPWGALFMVAVWEPKKGDKEQ